MAHVIGEWIGTKYEIISESGTNKYGEPLYDFKCRDCGFIYHSARYADICRKVKYKKGCNHNTQHTTHNKWRIPRIGKIYQNMRQRCYNPKSINYYNYGGRGIKICDEWLNDNTLFETWAINNGYQDTYEINRIDHDGDYCPENCEWVPPGYNSKFDRRDNYIFYVGNEKFTTADIDKRFNLRTGYCRNMISKYGEVYTQQWVNDLFSGKIKITSPYMKIKYYKLDNICMNLSEWSRYLGIGYSGLYYQYSNNKSNFDSYLRTKILENIGYIDIYGNNMTIDQVSYISGINSEYLKTNYILFGINVLYNALINNNNIQVVDFSNWR